MKAQLRFRVHPPRHRAAQDVVDRVVSAYDERLDMIVGEIAEMLGNVDPRRSNDEPLVIAVDAPLIAKGVVRAPFRPGSRGGKWYRDARGNVRYGEPPEGKFMGDAGSADPKPHVDHLRPRAFMGEFGNDRELTSFLVEHGDEHGFTDNELRFLTAWYGTGEEGGALFDAFCECAGITRDDLNTGVANLRFGGQKLTYEEAVFEFFAAQEALFMGEGSEDDSAPDGQAGGKKKPKPKKSTSKAVNDDDSGEWEKILNDEIKPLLDGVFIKYEEIKDDERLQQQFVTDPDRQRRRFFDAARRSGDDTSGVADVVAGDWSPDRQADVAVVGMYALGLFLHPARAERQAYIHGRPHLRDAVAMDGRLLRDEKNPLLDDKDKLTTLSSSNLMLLYAAAELHRRWDPHTKTYSTEKQADAGSGELGEAAFLALASKSEQWVEASDTIRERLEELVDSLVTKLNRVNAREGLPTKHGPARKPK